MPGAPRWEAEQRIGREAVEAAAAIGLTGLEVPTAWGGLGLGFTVKAQVAEALGAADFGFTMSLINTHNVAAKLAREAPAELARRYVPDLLAGRRLGCTALTEPGAGSDFAAIRTLASAHAAGLAHRRREGLDHQRGRGRRDRALRADRRRQRRPRHRLLPRRRPARGFQAPAGLCADRPACDRCRRLQLDGYIAHDEEMLQPPGRAFKSALGSINGARCYIAAMCNGMVGEALRTALAYGRERHSFGRPLAEHQGWRWRLAEAGAELAAARLLVAQAAAQVESGGDAQLLSAQAKLVSTRLAERQLPALAQAMGAEGLRREHCFGRHLAGARVASFVDGSSEMLLERIAALSRPR